MSSHCRITHRIGTLASAIEMWIGLDPKSSVSTPVCLIFRLWGGLLVLYYLVCKIWVQIPNQLWSSWCPSITILNSHLSHRFAMGDKIGSSLFGGVWVQYSKYLKGGQWMVERKPTYSACWKVGGLAPGQLNQEYFFLMLPSFLLLNTCQFLPNHPEIY